MLRVLFGVAIFLAATQTFTQEKIDYRVAGLTMEGCTCKVACNCPWSGVAHGCQGLSTIIVNGGSYNGVNLAGAKIAQGGVAGNRIYIYVDAKDAQRDAATAFARAYWKNEGTVLAVRNVKIDLSGQAGRYTLTIDNGKIARLTTEPVLGGDKKNPVAHSNADTPWPLMQARAVTGFFHDGDISFTLENTNSYFNEHIETRSGL
jgi:hypothetical protein